MKIIDILNKIANGEEPPEKIMYKELRYTLGSDYEYYCEEEISGLFAKLFDDVATDEILNEEVEILDKTQEEPPMFKKVDGEWYVNKEMVKWLDKQFPSISNNKPDKIEKAQKGYEYIKAKLFPIIDEIQKIEKQDDKIGKLNIALFDDDSLTTNNKLKHIAFRVNEIIDRLNKEE